MALRIMEIVKKGNRISHYVVKDDNNKIYKYTKDMLITEIENHNVSNAKIQRYNGSIIIRVSNNGVNSNKNSNSVADTIANNILANTKQILTGDKAVQALLRLKIGTPLQIKSSENYGWKQCIYMGEHLSREVYIKDFRFFDGSGIEGYFGYTKEFLTDPTRIGSKIQFKFGDNNPIEVAFLLNYMKKGPFNLN